MDLTLSHPPPPEIHRRQRRTYTSRKDPFHPVLNAEQEKAFQYTLSRWVRRTLTLKCGGGCRASGVTWNPTTNLKRSSDTPLSSSWCFHKRYPDAPERGGKRAGTGNRSEGCVVKKKSGTMPLAIRFPCKASPAIIRGICQRTGDLLSPQPKFCQEVLSHPPCALDLLCYSPPNATEYPVSISCKNTANKTPGDMFANAYRARERPWEGQPQRSLTLVFVRLAPRKIPRNSRSCWDDPHHSLG